LLIVVGDPEVLGKDELWRTFLNYIKLRKGWTGKGHSWNAEEVVHVPSYEIVPRKGGIVYGDEFIDGKSEMIYRVVEADSILTGHEGRSDGHKALRLFILYTQLYFQYFNTGG